MQVSQNQGPNVAANRVGPSCIVVASLLLLEACHSSGGDKQTLDGTVGLDARPSNLSCVAPSKTAAGGAAIQLQRVFPNLTFNQPLAMTQAPGDSSRWFVVQQRGRWVAALVA